LYRTFLARCANDPLTAGLEPVDQQCMAADFPDRRKPAEPDGDRRKAKRRIPDDLHTNFGPVLDLSAAGMRIISARALAGEIRVSIHGQGIDQSLRARVIRSQRIGFRVHEVAVEFIDHKDLHHVLEWIARWSSSRLRAT
jgi:hypothetical protein